MHDLNRPIRSFVLRQGRLSNAQRLAIETLGPRYIIPYSSVPLDFEVLFNRAAPTILEIGFGMGETTATIAQNNPQHNYLGIEVHTPGVGSLLKQINELALTNLRIIQYDAVAVVKEMIQPSSLAGIHVFFPDPWPKKRHHKRRLLQPEFVQLLATRLELDGYLHVATDWQDYAEQILAGLSAEPQLINTAQGYAERPSYRPLTKFEQRGLKLGHGVWDIIFKRKTYA